MNLKDIQAPGSLATWLIALILLINTLLLVVHGVLLRQLEQKYFRSESLLCGTVELQRGWVELQEARAEFNR